jgi:hypothetical protein
MTLRLLHSELLIYAEIFFFLSVYCTMIATLIPWMIILEPKGRGWEGGEEVLRISKIILEVSS